MKAFILFMENLLSRPGTASGISLREAIEAIKAAFPVPRNHKSDLPYAVRDLSRLLTQERGALHQSYWSAPRFVAAYTHFFLPWNLYRLSWLLPSLRLSLPAHGHVVDLGSGPLTLPLALWCFCPELRTVPLRFTCFDVSMRPMEIRRNILHDLAGSGSPWDVTLVRKPLDAALGALTSPVHLMTAGNVLNELPPPKRGTVEDRLAELMAAMHRKLAPEGRLLLVEPGNRLGGKVIAVARKGAIGCGFAPLAPCTHAGPCPMTDQQLYYPPSPPYSGWCHFIYPAVDAPEFLTSLGKRANLEKESLALSCLLLQKTADSGPAATAAESSARSSGGMDDLDDLEALYNEIMDDEEAPPPAQAAGRPRAPWNTPAPAQGDTLPDLQGAKRMHVRIISDYIRLPHELEPARYGCSPKGLVLVRDAVRVPSGGAVAVSLPGGSTGQRKSGAAEGGALGQNAASAHEGQVASPAEERDVKSGALMVDREGYSPGLGGPSASPTSREPREGSSERRGSSNEPREGSRGSRENSREPRDGSRGRREDSREPREGSRGRRDSSSSSGRGQQPGREERPSHSKGERDANHPLRQNREDTAGRKKHPPKRQGEDAPLRERSPAPRPAPPQGRKAPRTQGGGTSRSGGRGR